MAPVALPRDIEAAAVDLFRPRHATPNSSSSSSPSPSPSSPIAAIVARFHSSLSRRFSVLSRRLSVLSRPEPIPNPPPTQTLKTLLDAPSRILHARQQTTSTVPGAYPSLNSGPDPGTVVGITLGAVGGFLILLWLLYTCMSIGNADSASSYGTASVVTRKSRHRHTAAAAAATRHRSRHHSPRRETVEVRTSTTRGPVIVDEAQPPPPRGERVVMEETVRRSETRAPPPMPGPPPPRMVVPGDDDDEVVVIEEHSPPRRHKSKSHRRRSSSGTRRESGYREVDADRFAGGDAPFRGVRRTSRRMSGGR